MDLLVDTDFSDFTPPIANDANLVIDAPFSEGTLTIRGSRYNNTANPALIGGVTQDPATNPSIRNIRNGSNVVLTGGIPTNHFFSISPNRPFHNGGIINMTISGNGVGTPPGPLGGINIYCMTTGLLGTIDISGVPLQTIANVTFTLPADFSGLRTLGFARANVDGTIGGVTYFTWSVQIMTNLVDTSVELPIRDSRVESVVFYNITGVNVGSDWNILPAGIYIKKKTLSSGEVITEKVAKRGM